MSGRAVAITQGAWTGNPLICWASRAGHPHTERIPSTRDTKLRTRKPPPQVKRFLPAGAFCCVLPPRSGDWRGRRRESALNQEDTENSCLVPRSPPPPRDADLGPLLALKHPAAGGGGGVADNAVLKGSSPSPQDQLWGWVS